jgi:hypothetical protein
MTLSWCAAPAGAIRQPSLSFSSVTVQQPRLSSAGSSTGAKTSTTFLQETAVQSLVCLDRLRDASRFGPWMCGVALNLARRQLRDKVYERRWSPGQVKPALTEELLEEAETAAKVRGAIGR